MSKTITVPEHELRRALTEMAVLLCPKTDRHVGKQIYIKEKVSIAMCMLRRSSDGLSVWEYLPLDRKNREFSDEILTGE